ncbi:MAG: DUF3108 domain-containing protein [bacterium]|nr:DUF3108 domain-containing protein [bacterium]
MARRLFSFFVFGLIFLLFSSVVFAGLDEGKNLINQQKFDEALPILEKEYKSHPRDFDTKYYYALALMGSVNDTNYKKGLDFLIDIWGEKNNEEWNIEYKDRLSYALCSHPRLTIQAFLRGVEENLPQLAKLTLDNDFFKSYAQGQDWGAWMQKVINMKKYMFDDGKRDYNPKNIQTDTRGKVSEVKIMYKDKNGETGYNVFTLNRAGQRWRITDIKENFEDLFFLVESEYGSIDNKMLEKMGYSDPTNIQNNAFKEGEYLVFSLNYMGMKAGYGTLEVVSRTNYNGQECYYIKSRARSAPFFDFFYKVRNDYESYFDVNSFATLRFVEHQRESKHKADREIEFYPDRSILIYKNKEYPIPKNVKDVLASFYFVRAQNLKVGSEVSLLSNSKTKNYKLNVKVVGEEKLDTILGKVNTLIIEPDLKYESGIFKATGALHIWVTDDERHIPVQIKSAIKIGNITGTLIKYSTKGGPQGEDAFDDLFKEGK